MGESRRRRNVGSRTTKGGVNARVRGKKAKGASTPRGALGETGRLNRRSRILGWARLVFVAVIVFSLGAKWGRSRIHRPGMESGDHSFGSTAQSPGSGVNPSPILPISGEFEAQTAIILSANGLVQSYTDIFRQIVKEVCQSTHLICLVSNERERLAAQAVFDELALSDNAVTLRSLPLDNFWVRDYGPIFLRREDGSLLMADLKSPNEPQSELRLRNEVVPGAMGGMFDAPVVNVPLWIAGGNILNNGDGLCVTTVLGAFGSRSQIITKDGKLNYNRDDLNKVSSAMAKYLGVREWCCLPKLKDEPTGHVDMFVTFTAPDVAVVARCDPALDSVNAGILDESADILSRQKTSYGRPIRVMRIPMPPRTAEGYWRSYTNVVFANEIILVPSYSDVDPAVEKQAMDLYASLLPDMRVVPIVVDDIVGIEGYLHCMTSNVPAFVPLPGSVSLRRQ